MIKVLTFVHNYLSVSLRDIAIYCFLACKRVFLPFPLSQFLQHMLALLFSLPDSRGRLVAAPIPGSLIMNHHRHLPLFIVVRLHLIYRHDSRAYYSRFLFHRLRIYYSAARFRFVFYRLAFVSFRKPIDKIHIVTL